MDCFAEQVGLARGKIETGNDQHQQCKRCRQWHQSNRSLRLQSHGEHADAKRSPEYTIVAAQMGCCAAGVGQKRLNIDTNERAADDEERPAQKGDPSKASDQVAYGLDSIGVDRFSRYHCPHGQRPSQRKSVLLIVVTGRAGLQVRVERLSLGQR